MGQGPEVTQTSLDIGNTSFDDVTSALIYRKYQRRIHHALVTPHLSHCPKVHGKTYYEFHAPTFVIPCAPVITLVFAWPS